MIDRATCEQGLFQRPARVLSLLYHKVSRMQMRQPRIFTGKTPGIQPKRRTKKR